MDPNKRFTWAEICFLKIFCSENNCDKLKNLVKNGQIEIVGGGWVQHDETLSTYR